MRKRMHSGVQADCEEYKMSYETIFAGVFQRQIGMILQDSISNDQYKVEIINHIKATGERIYDTDPSKFSEDILTNLVKTLIESIAENQKGADRTAFLSSLNDYEKAVLIRFTRGKMDFRQIAREMKDNEDDIRAVYSRAKDTVNNTYMADVQGSALTPVGLLYSLDKSYKIPKAVKPPKTEKIIPPEPVKSAPSGFRRAGSLEIEPLPFTPQTPGLTYHPTNSSSIRIKGNTGQPQRTNEVRTGDNSFRYTPVNQPPVRVQKKSSTAAIFIILFLVGLFFVLLVVLIV